MTTPAALAPALAAWPAMSSMEAAATLARLAMSHGPAAERSRADLARDARPGGDPACMAHAQQPALTGRKDGAPVLRDHDPRQGSWPRTGRHLRSSRHP